MFKVQFYPPFLEGGGTDDGFLAEAGNDKKFIRE